LFFGHQPPKDMQRARRGCVCLSDDRVIESARSSRKQFGQSA
jgi:hypothetical protein